MPIGCVAAAPDANWEIESRQRLSAAKAVRRTVDYENCLTANAGCRSHRPKNFRLRRATTGSRLLRQVFAKPLDALQPLLDARHARGIAEANIIISPEGNAGNGGDLFRFQQFCAKIGGLQPRLDRKSVV